MSYDIPGWTTSQSGDPKPKTGIPEATTTTMAPARRQAHSTPLRYPLKIPCARCSSVTNGDLQLARTLPGFGAVVATGNKLLRAAMCALFTAHFKISTHFTRYLGSGGPCDCYGAEPPG